MVCLFLRTMVVLIYRGDDIAFLNLDELGLRFRYLQLGRWFGR